jgi:hypothetical protein
MRITCSVIGCRHTTGKFNDEWLCTNHWKLVSLTIKRRRAMLRRRAKRTGWTEQLIRMDDVLWERAKQQANERAMGI